MHRERERERERKKESVCACVQEVRGTQREGEIMCRERGRERKREQGIDGLGIRV